MPDGVNVAWASNATISQVLAATIKENYQYELKVSVGTWATETATYTIQLLAGTTQVAIASGTTPIDSFILVTLEFLSGNEYIGQPLKIALSSAAIESDFDMVTLNGSPVPLPGAVWLLGSGLLGLAGLRRKFKK